MADLVQGINTFLGIFFFVCFGYQLLYLFLGLIRRPKQFQATKEHSFAVLIPARNEEGVIGELIKSIKAQNYPAGKLHIFVCADNCTDRTADVARSLGATVYERQNKTLVGKGYTLNYLLSCISDDYSFENFEGFFVFDADNVLDKNYVSEMNKVFDNGYRVITSYRNSKNFASSWISSGYSVWFLRENRFLNNVRMINHTGCMISGTGFLMSREIVERNGGWKHHLLTEDLEFSVDTALAGEKIGYAGNAVFYDEQPITFADSWKQRMRWVKGGYQVFSRYGAKLLSSAVKKRDFTYYDIFMMVSPAMLVTLLGAVVNSVFIVLATLLLEHPMEVIGLCSVAIVLSFLSFYLLMFCVGALTVATERKHIHASAWAKLKAVATFPVYVFTYAPLALVALFRKVEWKPISHTIVKSAEEFNH